MTEWDFEVDVAVVGGGACGVMTALKAAENNDLSIAVFEKSTREGCNAAISSGSLAAGGTRFQADRGIVDSPAQHAADILAASRDEAFRPVVEALCQVAPRMVEWVADSGYPMEIGVDMPRAGMSVPRLHTDVGRVGGARLMRHLRDLVEQRPNIAFVDEAPVVELVADGAGRGVGGVVVTQNGVTQHVRARAVMIAADGFAQNRDLVDEHLSHLGSPYYGGVSTSTGDAIAWALRFGAQLRNMSAALRSGLVVAGYGTRVSPALPFNGAVLVNTDGVRFIDEESKGYSAMAAVLQEQPGERAAMVFDAVAMDATRESEMMRECLAAGAIRDAADVEELASELGLSRDRLADALRPRNGRRALQAPFRFAWVTHGILTTQGGLHISPGGEVLDPLGVPIPGLFAGGGTACGISGPSSDGYLSGNGLLSALGMGWIVGSALAAA